MFRLYLQLLCCLLRNHLSSTYYITESSLRFIVVQSDQLLKFSTRNEPSCDQFYSQTEANLLPQSFRPSFKRGVIHFDVQQPEPCSAHDVIQDLFFWFPLTHIIIKPYEKFVTHRTKLRTPSHQKPKRTLCNQPRCAVYLPLLDTFNH